MYEESKFLPSEVLRIIFHHLEDEDLIACSGVCRWWYQNVAEFLMMRSKLELCRWPDVFTSQAENVCLAGQISIDHIPKRRLRRLKSLKIWTGTTRSLSHEVVNLTLNLCKNLKSLELINLTKFEQALAEAILEHCRPGLRLRVTLRPQDGTWRPAIDFLGDHREMFEEILIENRETQEVIGWWPIPSAGASFRISALTKSASLDCPGLSRLECKSDSCVQSLTIENCYSLQETSLHNISSLKLRTLAIDGYNASESMWLQCFKNGFMVLNSLSLTRCKNITPNVSEALSYKNLKRLKIEVKRDSEHSISNLYKLDFLETLEIISDQLMTNALLDGVERHWPKLRELSVEENLYGYTSNIRTLKDMIESLKLRRKIKFTHRVRRTEINDDVPKSI